MRCRSLYALLLIPIAAIPSPAAAQYLGLWGGWNDQADGWQESRPQAGLARPAALDPGVGAVVPDAFPRIMDGGPRPQIVAEAPPIVELANDEVPGTILIDTAARRLYYTLSQSAAYEYPISVGREGFTWTGTETISRVAEWPDWHPPEEMRVRDPRLPEKMFGGIKNPLGSKALFLGNSLYRIHGTNDPKTIGLAASSGCFRMMNQHVEHLATIAPAGTVVKVMATLPPPKTVADLPWAQKPVGLGMARRNAVE